MSRSAIASLSRSAQPGALRLTELARLFGEGDEEFPWEKPRAARREKLFRESAAQSLRRNALSLAYAIQPERIGGALPMATLLLRDVVGGRVGLPDPGGALASPDGLCGIADDLSVETLVEAYARGLYPLAHSGPVKWWAPRTRCVAKPGEIPVGKGTRRHARQGKFKFTFDRDFDGVIAACAAPRAGRVPLTWITPRIMWAYAGLHDAGFAHSYEIWDEQGALIGGGYGVASGRVFVGESMFTRVSGAGAFGLAMLHRHLAHWGFALHDAKLPSPHLRSLGFRQMPREEYATYLCGRISTSRAGHWQSVPALCGLG